MDYEYDNKPMPEPGRYDRSVRVIFGILFVCAVFGAVGFFEIWDRPQEGLYNEEGAVDSTEKNEKELSSHVVYFNIKSSNGVVKLHTGMPKDSILILLGDPDEFSVTKVLDDYHENLDYHIKQSLYCDLSLEIINGILVNANKR